MPEPISTALTACNDMTAPAQQSVEPLIPLRVSAEARRNPMGHDFKNSPYRITSPENFIHFVFHALLHFRVSTVQQDFFLLVKRLNLGPRYFLAQGGVTNRDDMAEHFDAELAQKNLGECTNGDARRRLTSRGTLQNIASLGEVVFERARQIGMPGTRGSDALVAGRIACSDGKRFLPVLPVSIFQLNGNRRANRLAVTNTGKNMSRIALDLHAPTAAVALLPAPKFPVEKSLVNS